MKVGSTSPLPAARRAPATCGRSFWISFSAENRHRGDVWALVNSSRSRHTLAMRFGAVPLFVLSVVASAALGTSLAAAGTGPTGTKVSVYNPITPTGTLSSTLRVTAHIRGQCSGGGVAGRSSYRCITTSSRIVDPCFAAHPSGPFYCPTDVVGPDVVEINVRMRAATTSMEPAERRWAVELANGQVCIMVNAAWGGLGPLTCARTAKTRPGPVADCRVPVKGSSWWSASCQTKLSPSVPFTTYKAKRVWL